MFPLESARKELQDEARVFARELLAPEAEANDRLARFPEAIVRSMADAGFFGLPISTAFGGGGRDLFDLQLVVEELGRVDQSTAITLAAAVGLGAMPIATQGTDAQKQQWLPRLAAGRALAAFGVTEELAGSDVQRTATTAVAGDAGWVIDGAKSYVTNSGTALSELLVALVVTGDRVRDDGSHTSELSTILVPLKTEGVAVGPDYDKSGWRASDTHQVTLSNVRVPQDNLLGERGRGFAGIASTLDAGRVTVAALATGAAQGSLDEALEFSRARNVFGQPISSHQAIQFKLARMEARVHTARLAYYEAARLMLARVPFGHAAAIAKLTASEAAVDNSRDAVQILGARGLLNDSIAARQYRDSKVLEIGEGTSEIQLLVISRGLERR